MRCCRCGGECPHRRIALRQVDWIEAPRRMPTGIKQRGFVLKPTKNHTSGRAVSRVESSPWKDIASVSGHLCVDRRLKKGCLAGLMVRRPALRAWSSGEETTFESNITVRAQKLMQRRSYVEQETIVKTQTCVGIR